MNATVTRIVEIMFQDTIMTDEVCAIKDEVMNNCQERYQDLVERGFSEDEAMAAVVESLKGMEEVLAQYRQCASDEEEPEQNLTFAPEMVQTVKTALISENLTIRPGTDNQVHVLFNREDNPLLAVELANGILHIRRNGDGAAINGHMGKNFTSFNDFMKSLNQLMSGFSRTIISSGGDITITLPTDFAYEYLLSSTSGDVTMERIPAKTVNLTITSGDAEIEFAPETSVSLLRVMGNSGDVTIGGQMETANIRTVSGDVEISGDCKQLTVNTVSGDSSIRAAATHMNFQSVSGDMEVTAMDARLKEVSVKTTSGDMTLRLPAELQGKVAVEMQTLSGDRYGDCMACHGDPQTQVYMKSVSGDLRLC